MFSSLSVQSSCLLAVSQGLQDFRAGVSMNISQEFEGFVVWSQSVLAASYQGCFTLQMLCVRGSVYPYLAAETGLRTNWIAFLWNLGTGLWNLLLGFMWCVSRCGLVRGNLLSRCLSNNPPLPQCTIIYIYKFWSYNYCCNKSGNMVSDTIVIK